MTPTPSTCPSCVTAAVSDIVGPIRQRLRAHRLTHMRAWSTHCPHCGAAPGQPCTTAAGRSRGEDHHAARLLGGQP